MVMDTEKLIHSKKALYVAGTAIVLAGLFYLFLRPKAGVAPILDSVYPSTIAAGSEHTQLLLTGSGFDRDSVAMLGGTQYLQTSFFSDKQLNATVPSASLVTAGTLQVKVVNTTSGQSSGSVPVTVAGTANPPVLSSISPTTASVPDTSLSITATGTGFEADSVIKWGSTALTTTCPGATSCSAPVPTSLYAVAGNYPVTVNNGGLASSAIQFTVTDPNYSLIVVPNNGATPIPVQVGSPLTVKAIGNVASNGYSANWSIAPSGGVASIIPTSGLTTTFSCAQSGGPFTVTATYPGLMAGTAVYQCASSGGGGGGGSTINLSDCSQTALANAWGQMSSGSYVLKFPNCTTTWTANKTLTVPAAVASVTLQGNTIVNCTGTPGSSTYSCTSTDNTVLVDGFASGQPVLTLSAGAANSLRITGLTFRGGTGQAKFNGVINVGGGTPGLRVDHCRFNFNTYSPQNAGTAIQLNYSPVYGVIDHNLFEAPQQNNNVKVYNGTGYGDKEFNQPANLGSSQFIFIEDNLMNGGFANDCKNGGRMVLRYNRLIVVGYSGAYQSHGVGQGTENERTCRAIEAYHNYFHNPNPANNQFAGGEIGGGTGVDWGNTYTAGYSNVIVFRVLRELASGHAATPYPTGPGYCGVGSSGKSSPIDQNLDATGYACFDEVGRGQGDLLSGDWLPPAGHGSGCGKANSTLGSCPATWPRQKLEPWYQWLETKAAATAMALNMNFNGTAPAANRDDFPYTTVFNGTSGTGAGTHASRPLTCTMNPATYPAGNSPGVGYWETDTNTLFVCAGKDTWVQYYKPYQYPHPLDTGP